ncbi:MAG TPA: HAMP domain-containing sensor histidine kinase [Burkholderiales bacterium]|nr:HAMP domain-containing sensor histidine kinase [Burkholderiales bacterium]
MFRSLYSKLAFVLMAVFLVVGSIMILASQQMIEAGRLLELAADLIIGAIAFSLLAAFIVFKFLTRRLRDLAESVDGFLASGFARPVSLPTTHPTGDEIDRLASAFQEMSERIAKQLRDLERMNEQRRELLANVSHDLRTPLTSMQGYLETLLLKEGALSPDESRNYLQIAAKHCDRLGKLVRDLFELTKLEAHQVKPVMEIFPITELAQDVAQKFELAARSRGLRLITTIAPETPTIHADIGMMERVLENLIENAMRYTPSGGTLGIDIRPSGNRVVICVSDTGGGIPSAELPQIFERYYQADRGEFGNTGNAGLGLAITRRIVDLHGGHINVKSTLGEGTTFSIDLPAEGDGGNTR